MTCYEIVVLPGTPTVNGVCPSLCPYSRIAFVESFVPYAATQPESNDDSEQAVSLEVERKATP